MSELALAADTKLPAKLDDATRPPSGRTKRALDLMVHDGKTDSEAAVEVGITVTAIRLAIKKRGVRAYLDQQREVSRARICARNIHRLAEIRDKADNMPAIQAIRTLEQLGETDAVSSTARSSPGLVIIVQGSVAQAPSAPVSAQVIDNAGDE